MDLHRAFVHLHHGFHQRQADAQPAYRALQRRIDLHEYPEDTGKLVGWDADAGVSHSDDGDPPNPPL
jgi:hypothetical protein